MTRWHIVRDPEGRVNVYSDRQPGPIIGTGDFRKWSHVPGARWQTFEAACLSAAMHNGKVSTAAMVAAQNRDAEGSVAP